jgi:hypothetical protein
MSAFASGRLLEPLSRRSAPALVKAWIFRRRRAAPATPHRAHPPPDDDCWTGGRSDPTRCATSPRRNGAVPIPLHISLVRSKLLTRVKVVTQQASTNSLSCRADQQWDPARICLLCCERPLPHLRGHVRSNRRVLGRKQPYGGHTVCERDANGMAIPRVTREREPAQCRKQSRKRLPRTCEGEPSNLHLPRR